MREAHLGFAAPLEAPWWHVVGIGAGLTVVPVVALVGAVRLARPKSPWATARYDDAKRRRSAERFAADRPMTRLGRRAGDLVAGVPTRKPD